MNDTPPAGLGDVAAIIFIAIGVAISVVYPLVYNKVRGILPKTAGFLPDPVKKFMVASVWVALLAILSAVALYAFAKNADANLSLTWYGALVIGFGWEAGLEKLIVAPGIPRPVK